MRKPHAGKISQGSTEIGIPMVIVAILGAIALPRFWDALPLWGRVVSIGMIGVCLVAGFVFLGQPSGLGSRALEQEIRQAVKKDPSRTEGQDERSE